MKIIPFYRRTLCSSLAPARLGERLAENTQPRNLWKPSKFKPYEGKIRNDGFSISRVIGYRNSFLPVIEGRWQPDGKGSRISISFRMNYFVSGFVIVWCGFVSLACLAGIADAITNGFNLFIVAGPAMLLFMWAMLYIGFWREAKHAEADLENILMPEPGFC